MTQLDDEARALWAAVNGDAPAPEAAAGDLLRQLVEGLPQVGYDRLASPALSDGNLTWPVARQRA